MTDKVPFPDIKDINQMFLATYMKKRTPEPDPVPNSLEGLLDLLRKCWEFESKERPDAYVCHCMLDAAISKAELSSSFRHWEISTMDSEDMSNGGTGTDSIVAPGYRIYDNQVPPELQGTLKFTFGGMLERGYSFSAEVFQGSWVRPDGLSVAAAIKRASFWRKGISGDQLLTIHGAAGGLTFLHTLATPIVHGDIKPEDIIIQDNLEVGLCDVGYSNLVRDLYPPKDTILDFVEGPHFQTTGFHSPEVIQGAPVATAGDVYAFGGVILFTMSGKAPFEGRRPNEVAFVIDTGRRPRRDEHPQIPATDSLWSLIEGCCGFKPEWRPVMPTVLSTLEDEMGNP
ncbi:hypothetical protein FRC04_002948 [Tulasnella sp. 424]|nr:hypothetical protein FRC04_002948 [Tulasnella sp. 424]KAG8966367.1 hypothetical protein FRC05_002689 [Tulasnella sp. 425]